MSRKSGEGGGYGKPPRGRPFQPGQSGNPKGRPKKRKSAAEHFDDAMRQRLPVKQNGYEVMTEAGRLIFFNLTTEAARRNQRAVRNLLDFMRFFQSGAKDAPSGADQGELSKADEDMLNEYLAQKLAERVDVIEAPAPIEGVDSKIGSDKGVEKSTEEDMKRDDGANKLLDQTK